MMVSSVTPHERTSHGYVVEKQKEKGQKGRKVSEKENEYG